ncbi:MAG: protein-glutamate methylesterase/protein-glutamine glutaminase [bacterium]
MSPRRISVLIVDDSAFIRKAMKRMLGSDPMIKVLGDACDGFEALQRIKSLKPDVVTLDVKMPGMDGLQTLKQIMREYPVPVLMVSSLTGEGGEVTLQALEMGAVDFIDKSSCHTTMDILDIAESLIQKVKVIAKVDLKKVIESKPDPKLAPHPTRPTAAVTRDGNPSHLVAIGTSTGGPMALEKVLTPLPSNYPGAILVVQHMPLGFTRSLAQRMNQQCPMAVKEAEEGDIILPGNIYIAPSGYHLKIRRSMDKYHVILAKNPGNMPHCPSVDVMMQSVAENWSGKILGIIMTGMGNDGVEGIQAIKKRGGTTLAQNEETCVVFGMPKAAYLTGCVERMVPLSHVAEEIQRFA